MKQGLVVLFDIIYVFNSATSIRLDVAGVFSELFVANLNIFLVVLVYLLCMSYMSAVSLRSPKSLYASMSELARVGICLACDWKIMLALLVNISVMMV